MSRILEDMKKESFKEGRVEGITEGIEVGKKKGISEIVEKMLKDNSFSIQKISEISGLSVDEIETLKSAYEI